MKNTTKLKCILQLYTVFLEMDDEGILHFTIINKHTSAEETIVDKAYSVVIRKAYSHMLKELKAQEKGEV
jgi:hypothetical protein